MNTIDTSGMLCTCGKKLNYAGTDNGCHVLVCPVHSKKSYRIPMTDPMTLISPCEMVGITVKTTACRLCGTVIAEEQALRTFNEYGRAVCAECELKVGGGRLLP